MDEVAKWTNVVATVTVPDDVDVADTLDCLAAEAAKSSVLADAVGAANLKTRVVDLTVPVAHDDFESGRVVIVELMATMFTVVDACRCGLTDLRFDFVTVCADDGASVPC